MAKQTDCDGLKAFLRQLPAVAEPIAAGMRQRCWWVRFVIDIGHPKAWSVVQGLGYVLNSISEDDRLPIAFRPVSPSPALHGGPAQHLAWEIETTDRYFTPENAVEWLEGRLPRPVNDPAKWR